jgi:hypothetical protein
MVQAVQQIRLISTHLNLHHSIRIAGLRIIFPYMEFWNKLHYRHSATINTGHDDFSCSARRSNILVGTKAGIVDKAIRK